jgi:SAM-dependent methyltransferase
MKFNCQLNTEELSFLEAAIKSYSDNSLKPDILSLISEALQLRQFSDKFCMHLRSLTAKARILKKINNQYEESVLVGEQEGTYNDKLKNNEIFTDREILLVSLIKNYFYDKKILEVGCGAGQIAIFLKTCGVNIEACDLAPYRQNLTLQMCKFFNVDLPVYNQAYQELDLGRYDVIIAANIRHSKNNFLKDKALFEDFLLLENKFVILDWTDYSTVEEDKYAIKSFARAQIDRVLSFVQTRSGLTQRYANL